MDLRSVVDRDAAQGGVRTHRTLHAPLRALSRWAEEHIEEVLAARETYDADT